MPNIPDPSVVIPWQPCNIPDPIQAELNRRKTNRNFNYVEASQGQWNDLTGEWTNYKGPTTAWTRFCSNGYGVKHSDSTMDKPGFILFGGKNFYDGYGFKNNSGSFENIIGYTPNGVPHIIENDLNTSNYPIHVPSPEIEKISIVIQRELFRQASIEWTCFSSAQLEYMTPYFLVPGITCILEWGWNNFNPTSLVALDQDGKLKDIYNNPYPLYTKNILDSNGNYDVLFGIITNFEWSVDGNRIRCKTEITSKDRIYAGLVVESSPVDQFQINSQDEKVNPLNSLTQFVDITLPYFKSIPTINNIFDVQSVSSVVSNVSASNELVDFFNYVRQSHPTNYNEYIYGIFYGRYMEDDSKAVNNLYDNKKEDFDRKNPNGNLWISMGLLMEIINFHSSPLVMFKNKEMFRVDIDNCVIGGHPNMISSNGEVMLIPNSESPKYFWGSFGDFLKTSDTYTEQCSNPSTFIPESNFLPKSRAEQNGTLSDYRLFKVVVPPANPIGAGAYRDNLDEIINKLRYEKTTASNKTFSFPFPPGQTTISGSAGSKPYPDRYSGYLKNIYFNAKCLQNILANESEIKTYPQLITKLLDKINESSGNFWDFRLVHGSGDSTLSNNDLAAMKIVDDRFMATANKGNVYSFDYYDADSLLLGVDFKPTLSNAKAIQTIFSQVNNPTNQITLTNDPDDMMTLIYRDRLFSDDTKKPSLPQKQHQDVSHFTEVMRELQQAAPTGGSFQITTKDNNGNIITRRLALPKPEILSLLLDDGDIEQNPKYTGITVGIQAKFTIQGIGGLRTFMMFLVRNLPSPYSQKNIIFRIIDVQENIENGNWTTVITAGVIPLRNNIKTRLGITNH